MVKTIRCIVTKTADRIDTSFGNRLAFWDHAFKLVYRTNFEYKIVLQKELWQEFFFLKFPYTLLKSNDNFLGDESCEELTLDHTKKIINKNDLTLLKTKNHWFFDKIYNNSNLNIERKENNKTIILNPLKYIEFKNDQINQFFKNKFKDYVGIHIRRYSGVRFDPEDVLTLPENLQDIYLKHAKFFPYNPYERNSMYYQYPFIPDQIYFKSIDAILEANKNQKIYLSTDLPPQLYEYYKKRYPNIVDKYDLKTEYFSLLKEHYTVNILQNTQELLLDLLDFFALVHSKIVLQSYQSSWGNAASKVSGNVSIVLNKNDAKEQIIKSYLIKSNLVKRRWHSSKIGTPDLFF